MKERHIKCFGNRLYIKEFKRSWWRRWEIEKREILPILYERMSNGGYHIYISE